MTGSRPDSHVVFDAAEPWTNEKNARRLSLVDKVIQQVITPTETAELDRLTEQMRTAIDRDDALPLEGARLLRQKLLGLPASGQP